MTRVVCSLVIASALTLGASEARAAACTNLAKRVQGTWGFMATGHEVLTGVSLRRAAYEVGRVETSAVYFAPLSADDIAWYIASGEGNDKAGGYAIQGLASRFIPRIEGSYTNVVGLPVATVFELLNRFPSVVLD